MLAPTKGEAESTMRIGVARLWHEANSFAAAPTEAAAFHGREWLRGAAVAPFYAGTATEIGGALAWAAARKDVELVFSRCAAAPPGGPVVQGLLDAFTAEVSGDAALDGIDGLYLSLHGACLGTDDPAPEASLLAALRDRFPDLPIAASFDIHACLSRRVTDALNAATVYRTYPHVDMEAAAARALDLLAAMIAGGRRTRVTLRTIGRVLPSFNMRTDAGGPMAEAEALALALEAEAPAEALLAAYPYGSFAYADVESTDAGAVVTAADPGTAAAAAEALAGFLFSMRAAFRPDLPAAAEALAAKPWAGGRRVAVLEPSDNPLSGGQGDTPGLLAAALAAGVPEGSVFAFFCDPGLVGRARPAGEGAGLQVSLGGRVDPRFGDPVAGEATVLRLTDGRFTNAGPMERGLKVDLGPTALLRLGPLQVIVTTSCQSPNDINYFTLHGIDLDRLPLLLAKAKNHFTAAFKDRFDAILQVDTPGPAMADAARLPFRCVPPERLSLD
ncbi:MAG: M81 family metallopeptidase [Kiloniellaceae bacterium]